MGRGVPASRGLPTGKRRGVPPRTQSCRVRDDAKRGRICVEAVGAVEEHEWWRVKYDSLDAFYLAHEDRHPDIRLYAAVARDFPIPALSVESMNLPEGFGEVITREIASRRLPQSR